MGRGVAKAASSKRASTKKVATAAPPPTPNRPRPPEPLRHTAVKAEMLDYYRQMLLLRRFAARAGLLFGLGLTVRFCLPYLCLDAVSFCPQPSLAPATYTSLPSPRR